MRRVCSPASLAASPVGERDVALGRPAPALVLRRLQTTSSVFDQKSNSIPLFVRFALNSSVFNLSGANPRPTDCAAVPGPALLSEWQRLAESARDGAHSACPLHSNGDFGPNSSLPPLKEEISQIRLVPAQNQLKSENKSRPALGSRRH